MSAIDAAAEPGRFLGRQCMIQDNKQTFSESSKLAEALGVNFDDDYDPPQDGDKGIIRARIADWNGEIVVAVYVPVRDKIFAIVEKGVSYTESVTDTSTDGVVCNAPEKPGPQAPQPDPKTTAQAPASVKTFCGTCTGCTYKPLVAKTNCTYGSKCTNKDCKFAHASPAGSQRTAGSESKPCKSGIACTRADCKFAHPSPARKCLQADNKVDANCTPTSCTSPAAKKSSASRNTVEELLKFIVDKLQKSSTGCMMSSELGAVVKKNEAWNDVVSKVGGIKYFCMDHPKKIEFVKDGGGGKVQLVKEGKIPAGTKVYIKSEKPKFGWGDARAWSVGTVRSFTGTTYMVDFPETQRWKCDEKDLSSAIGYVDRSTKDIGVLDPSFDKFGFVSMSETLLTFTGNADNKRPRGLWEYGFVHGQKKLTPAQPYFEVKIVKHRDDGVGIGLSGETFFAGDMVGWVSDSIGFHSDDGAFFAGDGQGTPFGAPCKAGDTMGCGVIFDDDKPKTVYFTRNMQLVGRFPLRSEDVDMLYPVVTSGSPAIVDVNVSAQSPVVPPACVLKSFPLEAKYNDESNKFKPVTRKGPPNRKGETPVKFKNYKDTVWIPPHRLRKTDTPVSLEFSNLEQAFAVAADGDTVEVKNCGIHLMKDSIDISAAISVVGAGADLSSRPTISRGEGFAFKILATADVSLQNIIVKSYGGDITKTVSKGGSAGIVLKRGGLVIEACEISSTKGTGVIIDGDKSDEMLRRLSIEKTKIGPCGRHGIIVDKCSVPICIQEVHVHDIKQAGFASNGGDTNLKGCVIKDCANGMVFSGALKELSKISVQSSTISKCTTGVDVYGFEGNERHLILTGSTIENCKIAMEASGSKASIFCDKTSAIKDCSDERVVKDDAQIIKGDDALALSSQSDKPSAVKQQIEFYFSDSNLQTDTFLKDEMAKDLKGVKLAVIAGFKRMKVIEASVKDIAEAASKVPFLEVSADKLYVRRITPITAQISSNKEVASASDGGGPKAAISQEDERRDTASSPKSQTSAKEAKMSSASSTKSRKSSTDGSSVSSERSNLARFCRLLMDVGREVMDIIFNDNYCKQEKKEWLQSESCGRAFLDKNFDRVNQTKLGKTMVDKIRGGKCREWDITLLSALLLFTPGYLKENKAAKNAVEVLRNERNHLAHSHDLLANMSLNEQTFKEKWKLVGDALNTLIDLLKPEQKTSWTSKIDEIAKEDFVESAVQDVFQRMQTEIKLIQDLAEDASNKADQAVKLAENAASMTMVNRVRSEIKELESLMNHNGQIDQNRLPCEIRLSNESRYRVLKQVGKGGMGTVFQAKLIAPDSDERNVALKICDASQDRAEREAAILKRLADPEMNHVSSLSLCFHASKRYTSVSPQLCQ